MLQHTRLGAKNLRERSRRAGVSCGRSHVRQRLRGASPVFFAEVAALVYAAVF